MSFVIKNVDVSKDFAMTILRIADIQGYECSIEFLIIENNHFSIVTWKNILYFLTGIVNGKFVTVKHSVFKFYL